MKQIGKKTIAAMLFALLCTSILSLAVMAYENVSPEENVSLEEQFKTISDYMYSGGLTGSVGVTGVILAGDKITVGVTDEKTKDDVLSLPGISKDAIEFGTFEVTWTGPLKLISPAEADRIDRQNRVNRLISVGSMVPVLIPISNKTYTSQAPNPHGSRGFGASNLLEIGINNKYGAAVGYPTNSSGELFNAANHGAFRLGNVGNKWGTRLDGTARLLGKRWTSIFQRFY